MKFAGPSTEELHRLKSLKEENKRLKSLVADLSLDKKILQGVLAQGLGSVRLHHDGQIAQLGETSL